jgi:HEPN domain-containing protein
MIDKASIEEWFSISSDDLSVAFHCFENMYPKKLAIACYHCQQSAEKALKGFLVLQRIEPPKIHDLQLLCEMCIKQDASFNEIYEASSKLTPYGVATRYPKEIAVDEIITKAALQRAQKIHDFCLAKLPVAGNNTEAPANGEHEA